MRAATSAAAPAAAAPAAAAPAAVAPVNDTVITILRGIERGVNEINTKLTFPENINNIQELYDDLFRKMKQIATEIVEFTGNGHTFLKRMAILLIYNYIYSNPYIRTKYLHILSTSNPDPTDLRQLREIISYLAAYGLNFISGNKGSIDAEQKHIFNILTDNPFIEEKLNFRILLELLDGIIQAESETSPPQTYSYLHNAEESIKRTFRPSEASTGAVNSETLGNSIATSLVDKILKNDRFYGMVANRLGEVDLSNVPELLATKIDQRIDLTGINPQAISAAIADILTRGIQLNKDEITSNIGSKALTKINLPRSITGSEITSDLAARLATQQLSASIADSVARNFVIPQAVLAEIAKSAADLTFSLLQRTFQPNVLEPVLRYLISQKIPGISKQELMQLLVHHYNKDMYGNLRLRYRKGARIEELNEEKKEEVARRMKIDDSDPVVTPSQIAQYPASFLQPAQPQNPVPFDQAQAQPTTLVQPAPVSFSQAAQAQAQAQAQAAQAAQAATLVQPTPNNSFAQMQAQAQAAEAARAAKAAEAIKSATDAYKQSQAQVQAQDQAATLVQPPQTSQFPASSEPDKQKKSGWLSGITNLFWGNPKKDVTDSLVLPTANKGLLSGRTADLTYDDIIKAVNDLTKKGKNDYINENVSYSLGVGAEAVLRSYFSNLSTFSSILNDYNSLVKQLRRYGTKIYPETLKKYDQLFESTVNQMNLINIDPLPQNLVYAIKNSFVTKGHLKTADCIIGLVNGLGGDLFKKPSTESTSFSTTSGTTATTSQFGTTSSQPSSTNVTFGSDSTKKPTVFNGDIGKWPPGGILGGCYLNKPRLNILTAILRYMLERNII